MGIGNAHAPSTSRIRMVERDALSVVPEALPDRIVDDDVTESRHEGRAAGPGCGDVRDAALSANDVIARGGQPAAEGLAIAKVVLRRIWGLRIVAQEVDFWMRGALCDQRLQARDGEVRRIPRDMAFRRSGRELEAVNGELQSEPLVERRVEEKAVVVFAPPAGNDRLAVTEEVVGKAKTRLELILIWFSFGTGREVFVGNRDGPPLELERLAFESRHHECRCDVVLVQHVAFVIPTQSEVQR